MSKLILPNSPAVLRPDHPAWGLLDKLRKAFDIAHEVTEPSARVRMGRRAFLGRALSWGGGMLLGPAALELLDAHEAMAARTGFSASNYLIYNAALLNATPLTMSIWAFLTNITTAQEFMGIYNSASSTTRNIFRMDLTTGSKAEFGTGSSGSGSSATTANSANINAWNHIVGSSSSPTSRSITLNNGTTATNASSQTPTGQNRTAIGVGAGSSIVHPVIGSLAEAGMWNIELSADDKTVLSIGVAPPLVRPDALVGYWPLIGNNSPEPNFRDGASAMSITGSLSASAHPRVIYPN